VVFAEGYTGSDSKPVSAPNLFGLDVGRGQFEQRLRGGARRRLDGRTVDDRLQVAGERQTEATIDWKAPEGAPANPG
jgi:hypothetical protein